MRPRWTPPALADADLSRVPWPLDMPVPDSDPASSMILALFAQAVAASIVSQLDARQDAADNPRAMLTVSQTAEILGLSRMTVTRKADAGELPCLVVTRGTRQKLRRFPRPLIEALAAGGQGGQSDLADCTARWLAFVAGRTAAEHLD